MCRIGGNSLNQIDSGVQCTYKLHLVETKKERLLLCDYTRFYTYVYDVFYSPLQLKLFIGFYALQCGTYWTDVRSCESTIALQTINERNEGEMDNIHLSCRCAFQATQWTFESFKSFRMRTPRQWKATNQTIAFLADTRSSARCVRAFLPKCVLGRTEVGADLSFSDICWSKARLWR